jgi:hypothetical protein
MTNNDQPSTPYQPLPSSGIGGGLLCWLHNLFVPAVPAYSGDGQPAPQRGGLFGGTPIYSVATAPPATPAPSDPVPQPASVPGVGSTSQGPVTIVIAARD